MSATPKFDALIEAKTKVYLAEVYQDSNKIEDLVKVLKAIAQGGKPATNQRYELKNPKDLERLKKLLNPPYDTATKALGNKHIEIDRKIKDIAAAKAARPPDSAKVQQLTQEMQNLQQSMNPIVGNDINPNVVSANIYDVLFVSVLDGRPPFEFTLHQILSKKPKLKQSTTGKTVVDYSRSVDIEDQFRNSKMSMEDVKKKVDAVLARALASKVIRYKEERDLSPKSIANAAINKGVGAVKGAFNYAMDAAGQNIVKM